MDAAYGINIVNLDHCARGHELAGVFYMRPRLSGVVPHYTDDHRLTHVGRIRHENGLVPAQPCTGFRCCAEDHRADGRSRPDSTAMKKLGWVAVAFVIANEIRGIIVVATVGWPMIKAMW